MLATSLANATPAVVSLVEEDVTHPTTLELSAFRGILIAGTASAMLWGIGFALMWVMR